MNLDHLIDEFCVNNLLKRINLLNIKLKIVSYKLIRVYQHYCNFEYLREIDLKSQWHNPLIEKNCYDCMCT